MKRSMYRIIIAPFILSAIIIYIAFYSVGVVEKHTAAENAREHISNVVTNIYENNSEYNLITDQLCNEYELKVQTLSVLISQLPKTFSEDMTAEELRIASGADKIMISDKTGMIIFSTSPEAELEYVNDSFKEGLTKKNYRSTVIKKSDTDCIFEVAVSRRNENGLIIASFVNSALNEVLNYNGNSYVIHENSAFRPGITAITDLTTNKFIAHTNAALIDTECIISPERFRDESGYFSYSFQKEPSIVFYEHYDENTVILSIISKKEIYTNRTLVTIWMAILAAVILMAITLAIRQINNEKADE